MVTLKISQQQYREEKAQQALSPAEKLTQLTAGNAQLDRRTWSDEELRAIPNELVEFAYKNSASLRAEFRTYETFFAYWKHLQGSKTSKMRHK